MNPHSAETRPAAGPTASIVVAGVTVRYANGVTAVNEASFALGPGTICALVGVNGSGKSTIFKTLMGFLKPAHGMVSIAGMAVRDALKRGLVAYVPQAEEVDWTFPVLVDDVVMMGRYGHMGFLRLPRREDREAAEQALARVNMLEYRRRQIGELSGGQRKRVFLARALAQGGQVILLDEPFTGVDVRTEDAIVGLMRELRAEGRLMLVSTHNLGSIPDFCDQVVIINKAVLAAGPTETTFTQDNLQKAFGGALRHFRLEGASLHADADDRRVTVITDDERPLVFYGERNHEKPAAGKKDGRP